MIKVRLRHFGICYLILLLACVATLVANGDASFGRKPWQNLVRTAADFARPSFVDAWLGSERLEYKADDGRVLRVENRRAVEQQFLRGIASAAWITLLIGTLGSTLAALLALPLSFAAARNTRAPPWLAWPVRALLNACRAVHTLVFGLIFVGIVGLGPMAGILAIAAHSLGTYGKLFADRKSVV